MRIYLVPNAAFLPAQSPFSWLLPGKVRFYLFGSWKWKPANTQKLFANFLVPDTNSFFGSWKGAHGEFKKFAN